MQRKAAAYPIGTCLSTLGAVRTSLIRPAPSSTELHEPGTEILVWTTPC